MGVIKRVAKARTHRGKRELERRGPKLIENTKQSVFLRGTKCGENVQKLLKDMAKLKKPNATFMSKKNDYKPFEAANEIETLCMRHDASLFGFGSHNKKRPNNLIIGRLFDHQVLDMVEFGVDNLKGLDDFKNAKVGVGIKPCLLFAGEPFLSPSSDFFRIKNLLVDFFHGEEVTNIRLEGIEHVIAFTAAENKIYMRSYRIIMKKSGEKAPYVELEEIGPSVDLVLRRTKLASLDLFKSSCKKPKEIKAKKVKNISKDPFGSQLGRVHMPKQDLRRLPTRNMKGLRKTEAEKKIERASRVRSLKDKKTAGSTSSATDTGISNRSIRNRRGKGSKGGLTGANTTPLALSKVNTRQHAIQTGKGPMMIQSS